MPKYVYKCNICEDSFITFHGMTEDINKCELCHEEGSIKRIPQMLNIMKKETAGAVVREHIEQSRKELKEQKESRKTTMED